jgi:hypothetical protein
MTGNPEVTPRALNFRIADHSAVDATFVNTSPFVGTDPTTTSESAVIRADQHLLGHFGKRRAAFVSLQSARCCI